MQQFAPERGWVAFVCDDLFVMTCFLLYLRILKTNRVMVVLENKKKSQRTSRRPNCNNSRTSRAFTSGGNEHWVELL